MKKKFPLVSVGIPTYNRPQGLRRTLECITGQTYKNLEIIISDNCSPGPETEVVAREFITKDSRIQYFRQPENKGSIFNFNFVSKKATGEYFMWAADDDIYKPQFVSTLVKELEAHSEVGVAMCAVDRVREDGSLFDTIRFIDGDNPNHRSYYQMLKSLTSLKKYNLFICGLFRAQLLKRAWPDSLDVPSTLDRLVICQMSLAVRFRYVDQILYYKMIYQRAFKDRYPKHKYSRMLGEIWTDIKVLHGLSKILYQSSIIPWYRKLYIPVALWRYGWLLLYCRSRPERLFKACFHPVVWKQWRELKRRLLPD